MITEMPEKLLVNVQTAAKMLDLHPSRIWPMLAEGTIRSFKIGRNRKIAISELQRYVEAQMAAEGDRSPAA
jgi:excisionase family DNA binding protein